MEEHRVLEVERLLGARCGVVEAVEEFKDGFDNGRVVARDIDDILVRFLVRGVLSSALNKTWK